MFGSSDIGPRRNCPLLLVILLAACGGDRAEEAEPPEPDPLVSTEIRRETMTDADYGELEPAEVGLSVPWTSNRVSRDPDPEDEPARLTAVSTARSRGFDRLTFSFSPALPGYRLAMSTEAGGGCDGASPASDAPAHLVVEFERAVSNDGGSPLVSDRSRSTDFPALTSAVQACDADGKVRWLFGTSGLVDYRIMEMSVNPRLVVDLRHP